MIVFDTETTGLIKSIRLPDRVQPRIVELYAVKGSMVDGKFVISDELEFVVDPEIAISPEIHKITGIGQSDVNGKPKFAEYIPELKQFFLGESLVVGHNIRYDLDMLMLELRRTDDAMRFPWPPMAICTVQATTKIMGHRLSLTKLHQYLFGEGFHAHRAKSDVEATIRCLEALIEKKIVKLKEGAV